MRHVLWAMPEPGEALARWIGLLGPRGRLLLVEGCWSTSAGLTAEQVLSLLHRQGMDGRVRRLDDPELWGQSITDERYLVVAEH